MLTKRYDVTNMTVNICKNMYLMEKCADEIKLNVYIIIKLKKRKL